MLESLRVNDTFILSELYVPKVKRDGIEFLELKLKDVKVKVIDDFYGNKLCLFEDCLFKYAVNKQRDIAWENTALCKYLNTVFNDALENVLNCKVATNLLTSYEVFGDGKSSSNFPIAPKHYSLGKDELGSFKDKKNVYWLGTSYISYSFCDAYFAVGGYYTGVAWGDTYVRPAFLIKLNDELEIDSDKYNKKLQVLKATIESLYSQNGINNYKLDLFSEGFFVIIHGKNIWFDYSTMSLPENINKLREIQNLKIVMDD